MGRLCVSVIGSSSATPQERAWAAEVGRLLAENGIVLVCGGMGGVMEAACQAAQSAGGITVGILPAPNRDAGNRFLDIAIPTGMGYARNAIVAYSGHAVIAIGGSSGTLSEIAYATIRDIPVVTLGSWGLEERKLTHGARPMPATTPAEAVDKVLETVRR